jgi:hypothetical protein
VPATIEHKWSLPAPTERDAHANTVMACLDLSNKRLDEPSPPDAPPAP